MANQVDAAMTDTAIVLSQAAESGGRVEVIGQYTTGESYGAIYPKGSANAAVLDQVIQSMLDDGTIKRLAGKYLAEAWGADPTAIPYFKP
jgi:polar amino acid transport system substrate-binding protein